MGLRWGGINFESLVIEIREGYLEASHEAEVRVLGGTNYRWIRVSQPFCSNGSGFVWRRRETGFSPARAQRNPTILARCGRRCSMPRRYEPRFRDGSAGIRFRHSYRAWLDETGAPLGVQQKLMRHANISTTMNVYGGAFMESKRKANTSAVQRVLVQDHTK